MAKSTSCCETANAAVGLTRTTPLLRPGTVPFAVPIQPVRVPNAILFSPAAQAWFPSPRVLLLDAVAHVPQRILFAVLSILRVVWLHRIAVSGPPTQARLSGPLSPSDTDRWIQGSPPASPKPCDLDGIRWVSSDTWRSRWNRRWWTI